MASSPREPKEICRPLAEDPRYYDSATGDAKKDGYVRVCRRPRVMGVDECMPLERADRIEGIFDNPGMSPFDDDY